MPTDLKKVDTMPFESWIWEIIKLTIGVLIGSFFGTLIAYEIFKRRIKKEPDFKKIKSTLDDLKDKFEEISPFLEWLGDPQTYAKIQRIINNVDRFLKKLNKP